MKPPLLALFIDGHDDSDLLVRLRRRDSEAAGLLCDRYGKAAYAIAMRIVKDAALAEDIVAEAFLKVWNRVASFKETRCSALGLWFVAVTFAQARDYAQQGNPPKENVLEKAVIFQDWPRALDREGVEEIRWGLGLLTADERKVLDLCFFEALPPSRLAERLGLTGGETAKLVESALGKLSRAGGG